MFEPTLPHCLALVLAGVLSGGVNAIAGGGSLISFPTLTALGVPPIVANATNALAQVPGSFSSALGFREHVPHIREHLGPLSWPTWIGGGLGGLLLLNTSEKAFNTIVPVLILVATLLLMFQPQIKAWTVGRKTNSPSPLGGEDLTQPAARPWAVGYALQFVISVYGGYFGAGMGILMLAYLGLMIDADIHKLNALKSWLAVIINLVAGIVFALKGVVAWVPLLLVMTGSIIGGGVFSRMSQKVPSNSLRWIVVALGWVMFVAFARKAWLG